MKAIVYHEFGPPEVLKLEEMPTPVPENNEVLVKMHAVSVGFGDLFARNARNRPLSTFNMPGFLFPFVKISFGLKKPRIRILGAEFSGEIEAIGNNVKRFKKGDQVFGYLGSKMGAYAEYLCMPESGIVTLKPDNMTHEEAATIPYGAMMALPMLRKVNVKKGQKVLISGASGGIGSISVQLAKYLGADVTGVCGPQKLEYVKSLGADKVYDYTKEDFTKTDDTYDVIFDVMNKSSFSRCKRLLKPNGRYLLANFKMKQIFQMLWTSIAGRKKVICAMAFEKIEDLNFIKELIEAGKIKTIIDQVYPKEQAAEAHLYVEGGQARAKVIITM